PGDALLRQARAAELSRNVGPGGRTRGRPHRQSTGGRGGGLPRTSNRRKRRGNMRRTLIPLLLGSFVLAAAFGLMPPAAQAQPKTVKIGLIAPMSGPWARQGYLK